MDFACDFIGEFLLGDSLARVGDVLTGDIFDFFLRKESQGP
jgi:hypothetical protein